MNELKAAAQIISGRIPLVPLYCDVNGAAWRGKWHFNADTHWVKSIGGPWNTQEEAVAAALATGMYTLRAGTKTPHLDRK